MPHAIALSPPDLPGGRWGVVIALVLAGILLVSLLAYVRYLQAGPHETKSPGSAVAISSVEWLEGSSSCLSEPEGATSNGTTLATGAYFDVTQEVVGAQFGGSCIVYGAQLSPGFNVTQSNLPLDVQPNTGQTVELEIRAPSSPWGGVLTVTLLSSETLHNPP